MVFNASLFGHAKAERGHYLHEYGYEFILYLTHKARSWHLGALLDAHLLRQVGRKTEVSPIFQALVCLEEAS